MTIFALIAAALAATLAAHAVLVCRARRPRTWLDELMQETIVVVTRDDRSVQGRLVKVYDDEVVLGSPRYLNEAKSEDLPGELGVPRENVALYQRPKA